MKPLVSVIVPVYKVEDYLVCCLDSLCKQTLTNIEILLIDDASPDRCGEICDEYAAKDSRFMVIHLPENKGLSEARNTGISSASSDYLMFVDSDDCVHKDFCKDAYECAVRYRADLVMFNYIKVNKPCDITNKRLQGNKNESFLDGYKNKEEAMGLVYGSIGPFAWNKLCSKELFKDIIYPPGFYYEDMGATYKTVWKAHKIYYLNKFLYYHNCFRDGRITGLRNGKALRDWHELYMQQYHDLKEWGYSSEKLDSLYTHIALGYCIMKKKDMTDTVYNSSLSTVKDCKKFPVDFTLKRKVLFLLLKYCPPLFECICIVSGKKFC